MGIDITFSASYGSDPMFMMGPQFMGMDDAEPRRTFTWGQPAARSPVAPEQPVQRAHPPRAAVVPPKLTRSASGTQDTYAATRGQPSRRHGPEISTTAYIGHRQIPVQSNTYVNGRLVHSEVTGPVRKRSLSSSWETIHDAPQALTPICAQPRMVDRGVQTESQTRDVPQVAGESLMSYVMRWLFGG